MPQSVLREPLVALLVVGFLAAPATALAGLRRPSLAAPVGIATAALTFAAALWGWVDGGGRIDLPWAPTWRLRLSFALDGLATLYTLLATGIGLAVLVYARRYLPLHLEHQQRPATDGVRFYALILLFMGAMIGLATAQDLLLLFIFWDLTAVASYFLIGYDRQLPAARAAALMALLVTGVSAVCLLIGSVILAAPIGTFSLAEVLAAAEPGPSLTVAAALMVVACLAKSAQAPLHFWLPRAMTAPTPVSAYLHSAAMVAAGVFLLARLYPLIRLSDLLLGALIAVGFASMAVGGVLALAEDDLKRLLAYSTIAQYGYVVVLLGIGGGPGVAGAAFYVVAHALAKSALFLTAGAVIEASGESSLAHLGGLRRSLPALAVGSGAAAAGLAALPLTIGFFKDELFFAAARERGPPFAVAAVVGAAITFAYVGRFWIGIFLGPPRSATRPIPMLLIVPVLILGLLTVVGGVVASPVARLAEAASGASLPVPAAIAPAYHLDARPVNVMAVAAFSLGALILVAPPVWSNAATRFAWLGDRFGPERCYRLALAGLNRLSDRIHRFEVRDLRSRVATILVPTGILVLAGFAATPTEGAFVVGAMGRGDLPVLLALVAAAAAAVAVTFPRDHLTLALLLSGVGFSLAVIYALFGGPNVALVAVLMETLFALLFLGVLTAVPDRQLRRATDQPSAVGRRWRDRAVGIVAGIVAFLVVWGALSKPASLEGVAADQIALTPDAHAGNVVTAILADFRGLDTMGEITVIGVALVGIATLLRGGRLR